MRRLAIVMRKGIAATAAAIVIAASVFVPLLDSGPLATATHIEQPHDGGCVQFQHDHFACHVFHANSLQLPLVQRGGAAETVAPAQPLPPPVRAVAQARPPTTRSRAPPRA